MIPKMNQLSTRDTLFYFDRLGRIFEAKSWAEAESKTSFRAILEIDASTGGITKPVARAKTKAQIMEKMVEITKERVGDKRMIIYTLGVSGTMKAAKRKFFGERTLEDFESVKEPV